MDKDIGWSSVASGGMRRGMMLWLRVIWGRGRGFAHGSSIAPSSLGWWMVLTLMSTHMSIRGLLTLGGGSDNGRDKCLCHIQDLLVSANGH